MVESGQTLTTIRDFTDGDDQIDLSNISGITAFSDLTITDDNGTAVIDLSSQGAGTIGRRHHGPGCGRLRVLPVDDGM